MRMLFFSLFVFISFHKNKTKKIKNKKRKNEGDCRWCFVLNVRFLDVIIFFNDIENESGIINESGIENVPIDSPENLSIMSLRRSYDHTIDS